MRHLKLLAVVAATGLFFGPGVRRASAVVGIDWGTPVTISQDTDVYTVGSLLYAYNLGTTGVSSTTISGVTFSSFAASGSSTTVGSVTLSANGGSLVSSNTAYGAASAPFTSLSSAYQTLLDSGTTPTSSTSMTVTFGGLTASQSYTFEVWVNESTTVDNTLSNKTAVSGLPSATLNDNSTGATGGVGQWVTGTFTASSSSTTATFTATGTSAVPDLNALEVRSTPEPATVSFLGFGATGLLRRRRKMKNAN